MNRKLALFVAMGAAIVGLILLAWRLRSDDERSMEELDNVHYSQSDQWMNFYASDVAQGTGWLHFPKPRASPLYRSGVDPAVKGFISPRVCGECHQEEWESFLKTAHNSTSNLANRKSVLGDFEGDAALLKTRDPHLHFELTSEEDGLYQHVIVQQDGKTYRHRERFDLVVGSGNHGQSYLYWMGDDLFQLPVSYFSESGGWINSPGLYQDGTADFGRGIRERCLDCHATFFAAAPGAQNRYDRENFILGVTCVRCHGPGWAHVQFHRTHPDDTKPHYIVHPGKLSRERANDVCAQCHSGAGTQRQPAFTYLPGQPLEKYLKIDTSEANPGNDDPHAANQLARLMQSRCYQKSDNLTCATCHDPHRPERGQREIFAQRCGKCHQHNDCHVSTELGERGKHSCVECHMPSRRDAEGAMQMAQGEALPLLRDHFVKVWPEVAERILRELKTSDQE